MTKQNKNQTVRHVCYSNGVCNDYIIPKNSMSDWSWLTSSRYLSTSGMRAVLGVARAEKPEGVCGKYSMEV